MLTTHKNGAEQEAEIVTRYANGAEQEAEGVYRVKNGAEEETWVAIKWMSEMNNTLPSGAIVGYTVDSGSGYEGWSIWYFEGNTGGGSVTYYLDGEFNNPTISFDYDGFFGYTPGGTYTQATVGKLELYTRTQAGAEGYSEAVASIRVTEGQEHFSKTLSGTFNRVGFRFTFQNWGSGVADMGPQYLFNIYNIFIDGKECLPSEDCVRT